MPLFIRNKLIDTPIDVILTTLKKEIGGKLLHDIYPEVRGNIAVTCPVHKNGQERHPSCNIYTKHDDESTEYGKVHCFTCGYTDSLAGLVGKCFGEDLSFGEEWLVERFGVSFSENARFLPEIILKPPKLKKQFLDPSVLNNYNYYHPYMWERKLSKQVVDTFQVGYDDKTKSITFPIWDENDNLVMITYRSVKDKRFYIEENKDKPVYLLNFIKKWNIKSVIVVESQINALTLFSWGYPAIALIGTGSSSQFDILNKSGITDYTLAFDGDEAGDKAIKRFQKNIRNDVFVSYKKIPRGKDVNDLTKEQFDSLEEIF